VILSQETVYDEGKAVGVKVTGTYGDDNDLAAELIINLDGSWSFAQHVPFEHSGEGKVGLADLLTDFGLGALIVKDGDGDTVNFKLSFQLGDAGPSFAEGANSHTLQGLEGLIVGNRPAAELTYVAIAAGEENAITELAAVDFGADGPHAATPLGFAGFATVDVLSPEGLTLAGTETQVNLVQIPGENGVTVRAYTGESYSDETRAAELIINLDGSWSFAQYAPFAHPVEGAVGLDDLLQSFGLGDLVIMDGDGDTVNFKLSFKLSFKLGDDESTFVQGADSHTLQGLQGLLVNKDPGEELTYVSIAAGEENAITEPAAVDFGADGPHATEPFEHSGEGAVGLGDLLQDFGLGDLIAKDGDGDTVNFKLSFQLGDDALFGGAGNDILLGGAVNVSQYAELLDDLGKVLDGSEKDVAQLVEETIVLYQSSSFDGDNLLDGNAGDNLLDGGAGDNLLDGGAGDDLIIGGSGNDLIIGGLGADTLYGGSGNNTFAFSSEDMQWEGKDVIVDFTLGEDKLRIEALLDEGNQEIDLGKLTFDVVDDVLSLQVGESSHIIEIHFADNSLAPGALSSDDAVLALLQNMLG
jgi:Ca2+-binding RTX toxin-like protein